MVLWETDHFKTSSLQIKPEVQAKLGANHELKEFVVEKFKTQVVAGTNYYLKVYVVHACSMKCEVQCAS